MHGRLSFSRLIILNLLDFLLCLLDSVALISLLTECVRSRCYYQALLQVIREEKLEFITSLLKIANPAIAHNYHHLSPDRAHYTMACERCASPILRGEETIGCEGFCSNSYHLKCVHLTTEEKKSYLLNRYMLWICTTCSELLRAVRYGKKMQDEYRSFTSKAAGGCNKISSDKCDLTNEIFGIKEEIVAIQKSLAELTGSRFSVSCTSTNDQPIAHSSPTVVTSDELMQGSRISDRQCIAQSPIMTGNTNEKCWLFFTRIKNDVSEHEMQAMVADSLRTTETIHVRKLVPDWKDTSLLPFVSFKVGINVKFKEKALRSSTWPKGILFREFRERNFIWEPQRSV